MRREKERKNKTIGCGAINLVMNPASKCAYKKKKVYELKLFIALSAINTTTIIVFILTIGFNNGSK